MPDNTGGENLEQGEVFLAVAASLPVLCLLPTLSRSDSEFARVHGRQGIVLFLSELGAAMLAFVPVVGLWLSGGLLLGLAAAAFVSVREVLRGRVWKIPGIGAVADYLHNLAP